MPPFGHSRTACSTAASRLSAHETMQLDDARHRRRVLARLARALLEAPQQHARSSRRRADRDDAVGDAPGALAVDRAGGGDVDRRRRRRAACRACALSSVEVLALVLDHLAGEELADDLDRLLQDLQPDRRLRPVARRRCARSAPRPRRCPGRSGPGTSPPASPAACARIAGW